MKRVLVAAVVGAFTVGTAMAGTEAAGSAEETFASLDTDQNGSLTMEEASKLKGLAEKFAEVDADADGALSLAEFQNGYPQQ